MCSECVQTIVCSAILEHKVNVFRMCSDHCVFCHSQTQSECVQTIVCAAILKQKVHIKLAVSPLTTASFALWLRCPHQERKIRGSIPACPVGIFPGRVMPVTYKLALRWLPCRAFGLIGPVLRLVGPVSVYYDWMR